MPEKPVRDEIFTSRLEQRFFRWYRRVFSIQEIEESTLLKWFFGATLLSFFATFYAWIGSGVITIQNYLAVRHVCWPWFQTCGDYYFLEALPHGYSQTTFYMALMGLMLLIVYLMYRREWVLAHMGMLVLFLWKFFVVFFFTFLQSGNYEYYHLVFTAILLFFPLKIFFLQLSFVLFYTLSASSKIHETWIAGTYFSTLQAGLPIFPDWSIPVWTNLVMLMQIIGAWFLMSSNLVVQRLALIFFIIFHLYSGVLVSYRYPVTVLPSLIILFGLFYEPSKVPLSKKSIPGWTLITLLIIFQLWSVIIPGDERLNGEANKYGMYMFEANHQCISTAKIHRGDGVVYPIERESELARHRCEPYRYWFQLQEFCRRNGDEIERISWTFDHSINGGPFYRIVDTEDVCSLQYSAWWRNDWIKPVDTAEVIGYPVKNLYY